MHKQPRTKWIGLALASLVAVLCASGLPAVWASTAQTWPQWRGPLGTGVAPEANPPTEWSETNHVKWKVTIPGRGKSTPIVWENQIFIQTAIATGRKAEPAAAASDPARAPDAPPPGGLGRGRGRGMDSPKPTEAYQFVILCLDRATGKVLWQQVAREQVPHEGFRPGDGSFASSSPVTDGRHVFAYFGSRGLYCYDLTGKLEWSQDLGQMRIVMGFGEGSSPALHGDTLVVNWDHEGGSFIVALDKHTGKTLWKQPRDERTSWSTPLVVPRDGGQQLVVAATGKIRSYDLATGAVLWECGGLTRNVIPTPTTGDGLLFATSGFQGSALLAIRLDRSGDLTDTDAIVWRHGKSTPYVPSPLLYADRIYFFAVNNGILSCLDARSGRVLFDAERIEALPGVYASPVAAPGKVYLTGRTGATVVLKPSDKFEGLATNRLDEKFDASPAIVGNELLLRGEAFLYCIAEN